MPRGCGLEMQQLRAVGSSYWAREFVKTRVLAPRGCVGRYGSAVPAEAKRLHPRGERGGRQAEQSRPLPRRRSASASPRALAGCSRARAGPAPARSTADGRAADARSGRGGDARERPLEVELPVLRGDDGALDHVLQLAHVAGPRVCREAAAASGPCGVEPLPCAGANWRGEGLGEQQRRRRRARAAAGWRSETR